MSVAMTNCGALGWTTDRHGYLYAPVDPVTDQTWPPMPAVFHELALAAARRRLSGLFPDACLINRYQPGAKLSLHQDKDEQDLRAPIVSVSLGLPAIFQFGGCSAATRCSGCCWSMAMWWSGAASRACFIMAFSR
jgi:alkylated DNA repair protein (DNA oxidative demethylase)